MRRAIPLLALMLAGCARPPVTRGGIVSTNPCADAMLVDLVSSDRIAAISAYSKEPGSSSIPPDVAARFASTAGTAEEVIALHPDLVLTSSLTSAATRSAYARGGLRVLTLDSPTTIAASETQVRTLAAAAGVSGAGEAMVARIERAVAEAVPGLRPGSSLEDGRHAGRAPTDGRSPPGPRPSPGSGVEPAALLYIAGNLANGSGTLLDELMRRAGFRNAAADYGLAFTGTIPVETIAAHPPRVIIGAHDGRTAALRRRVLARLGTPVVEADFPRRLMNCGGPVIVPALARLAAIRREVRS